MQELSTTVRGKTKSRESPTLLLVVIPWPEIFTQLIQRIRETLISMNITTTEKNNFKNNTTTNNGTETETIPNLISRQIDESAKDCPPSPDHLITLHRSSRSSSNTKSNTKRKFHLHSYLPSCRPYRLETTRAKMLVIRTTVTTATPPIEIPKRASIGILLTQVK